MTGCVQLVSEVLNDCAQLLSTIESTPPQDSSSSDEEVDWLPFWTGVVGAIAGIGGTVLGQFISGRNENKRLEAQNKREDDNSHREERKLLYAELLRYLDEYVLVISRYKNSEPVVKSLPILGVKGSESNAILEKREALSERSVALAGSILSTLGVIDLVGDEDVYTYAFAYFGEIRDIDPNDENSKARAQLLNTQMTTAMRSSLAGEPMPKELNLDQFKDQGKQKEPATTNSTPKDSGEAGTEKPDDPTKQ